MFEGEFFMGLRIDIWSVGLKFLKVYSVMVDFLVNF